jgi:hypothetical protein
MLITNSPNWVQLTALGIAFCANTYKENLGIAFCANTYKENIKGKWYFIVIHLIKYYLL